MIGHTYAGYGDTAGRADEKGTGPGKKGELIYG